MNFNAIIAVLILKRVITEDEAERLVEYLNNKPQSTVLKDAIASVAEVIGKPAPIVHQPLGPVGPAQQAEELAARAAPVEPPPTTPTPAPESTPPAPEAPAEPELAANEAVVDKDQADEAPSDTDNEEQPANNEPAKSTSVAKSEKPAKKK